MMEMIKELVVQELNALGICSWTDLYDSHKFVIMIVIRWGRTAEHPWIPCDPKQIVVRSTIVKYTTNQHTIEYEINDPEFPDNMCDDIRRDNMAFLDINKC